MYINLTDNELYTFMNKVLSQSYRQRQIVTNVKDTRKLTSKSKELLNDRKMPESIKQFFYTVYKPYDRMYEKFVDMTKWTLGSPCYEGYPRIDIVEFYLRMIQYLLKSKMLHRIGQGLNAVVFMHSSTTGGNMWKVPDFTKFDKKNMHVKLEDDEDILNQSFRSTRNTSRFIKRYNKIVKDVINGNSDELRYIANTLGGPYIQTFSNCAGPNFEKPTPESRRDNCSLFKSHVMCVCHGHQPNALAMMIREEKNKCRLSLDTRFSGLSIGIGYIGDAIKVQPTELDNLFNSENYFCASLNEADLQFEKILQINKLQQKIAEAKKEGKKTLVASLEKELENKKSHTKPSEPYIRTSYRAVIGPVVGKTKKGKVVRLVFFKDGFTQAVILVCDERLQTDDEITSKTYYNTIGHFYGDIKTRDKGVFTSINAGGPNVCTKTLKEGKFTRPDTLSEFGFDPQSKVITPKIKIVDEKNNKISITYAFSTRDKFCGQIYEYNLPLKIVDFVDDDEHIQSIVVGTDCEGFVEDLKLLDEAAADLKPKHVVFCGDVVDHGDDTKFSCLDKIEEMRKSNKYKFTSIIGNRDINKLRLMEILKGEHVGWWNYMEDNNKYGPQHDPPQHDPYQYPGIKNKAPAEGWTAYAEKYKEKTNATIDIS